MANMPSRVYRVLLCVLVVCGCLLNGSRAASLEPITLLTEEWPPYNYSEASQLKGVSVDIVTALLSELGREDPIQVLPSARARKMLDNNKRTMMFSFFRTKEREHHYKWIGPIGRDAIYFYKKKGSPLVINTLEDAKKVSTIACRQTGLVSTILKEAGFKNLDTSAYNSEQIYRKLLLGRCELAISDSPLGVTYLLKKIGLPSDALVQTNLKVVESDLYIACSRDIPDAEIALWQRALVRMKQNGLFERIVSGAKATY